jgi:hypothetical protein
MGNEEDGSTNELMQAMKQLVEALGLVYAAGGALAAFERMPLDRAQAITAGIADQTACLGFSVDFGPRHQLKVICSVVEEDGKVTTLFDVGGLTHNLGNAELFLVKKKPSIESEEKR